MDFLNFMLFGKTFGICAFCGKKLKIKDAIFNKKNVCICTECNSRIKITPFNFLHEGTENVSFVISPLYYTDVMRHAIHNLKFSSTPAIASALGYYINTYLKVFDDILNEFDLIIPVPLSKERKTVRGYNQAELLAREINEAFNIPLDTKSLIKIKDTLPQSILSHAERKENIKDAYRCTCKLKDKRILLADDVFTTGNTLEACAKELLKQEAKSVSAITAVYAKAREHSELYYDLFS